MGHETQLIPDATFFIQLAIFLATYAVLKLLVFDPYLKLIHLREAKTKGLLEEAAKNRVIAEGLKQDYDAFMKVERQKLSVWLEDERKKVSDHERALLTKAREKVSKEMQVTRDQILGEVKEAKKTLSGEVREYAEQISSKILGRKVSLNGKSKPATESRVTP